jgi:pimeloyl-ACP methyl ester carboxylesterase
MILLHGAGEFAATWMRVIPALSATHRVVAPDLPGHGASGIGEGALDAERIMAWMNELVGRTCATPPVLIGHLLGGAIAARYAIRHGERVASLVLVDSFGLSRLWPAARFALALIHYLARPSERTQERLFQQCFVDFDGIRNDMGTSWEPLAAYALDGARSPDLKAALRTLMPQLGLPAIPPEELDRIGVPTALIWGRHDLQVRLSVAEAASARHGWPLHVIEGAADDPAFEQPAAFMNALRERLEAPSGGAMSARLNPTKHEVAV